MSDKPMKIPGPDHPITIVDHPNRVRVSVAGRVIAETRAAKLVREGSYPPVFYIPQADLDMSLVEKSDHKTYCPYKGEASYFSIPAGGERSKNAIWSYPAPHAAVAVIAGHVAFYPDRIDEIEDLPA